MFKLMIVVESQIDMLKFEKSWPEFLKLAEQMPGLRKESFSPVYARVYGDAQITMVHELYFDTPDALQEALGSEVGQKAGRKLQQITEGKFSLLFADHLEDELKNLLNEEEKEPDEDDAQG